MSARVAVVGGGLAGITTALGCADAGRDVTLFEARPRLGGLTHSFPRHGMWVDNGQHVFLRCCTSYLRLLERLGVSDLVHVQPRLDVPVRSGAHPDTARLRRSGLPAPLHLAGALARYRWLSPAQRLRAARAALALGRLDRTDPELDQHSFGSWLADHAQDARAIEALWDLIGVATLNARADRASLALAATVFQVGLLGDADAADIGWSGVPLQQLHGDPAARELELANVPVAGKVVGLDQHADGWLVRTDETASVFDQVVLAVPPSAAEPLLPTGAVDLESGWAQALGVTPILNLHLVFDRHVLDEPFVACVDSELQWVFDRTEQAGLDPAQGQYVAVSLSAADAMVGLPVAALREWVLPRLRRLLPATTSARVKEFFVTREPQATFRASPGSARRRPGTTTRLPGLYLAGAWTDTGWPATMEGAVRSGESAVTAVVSGLTGSPDVLRAGRGGSHNAGRPGVGALS